VICFGKRKLTIKNTTTKEAHFGGLFYYRRYALDTLLTNLVPLMRDIDDAIDEAEEQIY
jgi:hypothetical protein